MTALHDRSQGYYMALNQQRYDLALNEADEEDAIDAAAARALPPITNALMLQEYLPIEVPSELRKQLAFLEGYVWFSEEKVNRAVKCCMAAAALSQTSNAQLYEALERATGRSIARPASSNKYQFFIDQILNLHCQDVDMYHEDRALNAVRINATGARPQKSGDIPVVIQKNSARYELALKEFSWPWPVPDRVIDAVADFALQTPPDEFWIADYVVKSSHASCSRVVYASFGNWHVEVARWD